jgi:hypothetical protein
MISPNGNEKSRPGEVFDCYRAIDPFTINQIESVPFHRYEDDRPGFMTF